MAKRRPFLICEWPYVGDGLGRDPRFPSLERAETAARDLTARTGCKFNVVQDTEGARVVLATTARDVHGRVWTDATGDGARLFPLI